MIIALLMVERVGISGFLPWVLRDLRLPPFTALIAIEDGLQLFGAKQVLYLGNLFLLERLFLILTRSAFDLVIILLC